MKRINQNVLSGKHINDGKTTAPSSNGWGGFASSGRGLARLLLMKHPNEEEGGLAALNVTLTHAGR